MLSSQLRDEILAFVERRENVSELEEWVVPRIQQFLQYTDTADGEAVAAIELGLVEIGQGIATEDELRSDLADLLQRDESTLIRTTNVSTSGSAANPTFKLPTVQINDQTTTVLAWDLR